MRRVALVVVAVALLVFAAPARSTPAGLDGLALTASDRLGPRLEELRFTTPALVGETSVRVLLPDGYDDPANASQRYPVLYLLHGGGGSFRDWTEQGDAEALTAGLPLIVVMPDGSGFGNYVDWWNFGAGGPPMWETYHLGQLLPWLDDHYRTVGTRDGRAIAGLSMGGGGAMHYATRHPDQFTAAAAFSGAVDTNTLPVQLLVEGSGPQGGRPLGAVTGHRLDDEIRWRGHNPWDLAGNLRGMFLQLDTGTIGDPIELAVWEQMTNLHRRLTALGIDHVWDVNAPGGHRWPFWQQDLRELLPRLMDRFATPVAAPSPFDFTSIDPTYSVWGWDVAVDRPALEFSRLGGAGPDGFVLSGSGSAVVTTGPLFAPGSAVSVSVADASGGATSSVVADGDGRLTVPVSLGPGNPYQELSPLGNLWRIQTRGLTADWPSVTAVVTFSR